MPNRVRGGKPASIRLIMPLMLACVSVALLGFAAARKLENATNMQGAFGSDLPNRRLSPSEVVAIQLKALESFGTRKDAIARCYAFASPANKAETGPLEEFTKMLVESEYSVLLGPSPAQLGSAVVSGDYATVLTSKLDDRNQAHVFRFFLSKQQVHPYEGCWMTDTVFEASPQPPGPPDEPDRDVLRLDDKGREAGIVIDAKMPSPFIAANFWISPYVNSRVSLLESIAERAPWTSAAAYSSR